MEIVLYEAAREGSVTSLLDLLRQDQLILDRVIVNGVSETPLHVAAMLGHTDFAKEIIRRKPELARELDSRQSSPLHLASAKGYVEIVKALLLVSPDTCLVRDVEGRNPLHLSAMKGLAEVLKELVRARPHAAHATVGFGETISHMCVRYNQLEALKLLMEIMDENEFVNAKDDYGMTILHLAVADKQIETINFLLFNSGVEVNALNTNGFTALDILVQSRRDAKDLDIGESLRNAGALKATDISLSMQRFGATRSTRCAPLVALDQIMPLHSSEGNNVQHKIKTEDWLTRKRDALMVVASLIATMAFQAGLNPPGGVWQDDSTGGGNNGTGAHLAGTSIMAYKYQSVYSLYLSYNTTGFIASLSIILLLITGLPFKRRFFMWVLTVIMWVAITAMALTYKVSIVILTPKEDLETVTQVIEYAVKVWCGVMAFLLLGHTVRLAANLFRKFENLLGKKRRPFPLVYVNHAG